MAKTEVYENAFYKALQRFENLNYWRARTLPSNAVILDQGCGFGAEIARIASNHEGFVIGNDIDPQSLKVAKKLIKIKCQSSGNVDFVLGDSAQLPFREGQFDYVLSTYVLEHMRKRSIALNEAYRVLKNGGCAIFTLDTYFRCIRRALWGYRNYVLTLFRSDLRKKDCEARALRWSKRNIIPRSYSDPKIPTNLSSKIKNGVNKISFIVFPIRHGEFDSSTEEFVANLPSSWVNLISASPFKKLEILPSSVEQRVKRSPGEIIIRAYKVCA